MAIGTAASLIIGETAILMVGGGKLEVGIILLALDALLLMFAIDKFPKAWREITQNLGK